MTPMTAPGPHADGDETPPSPLLTYVAFRDQLDQEHGQLYRALRRILADCESATAVELSLERLNGFVALLTGHHETENAILQVLQSEQWRAHVKVHDEIGALSLGILARATAQRAVEPSEVKRLLAIMEKHIDTMDHELCAAVNN